MLFGPIKLVLFLLLLTFVAGSVRLFLWPREDAPKRADAVVVLAGSRGPRLEKGLELMRERVAPVLVISDAPAPGWPEANRLCRRGASYRVICFKPDPYSTRGEAQRVARMANRLRWKRIVVVTSTFHVFRARTLFERCVGIGTKVDAVGARYALQRTPRYVLSEWVKLAYAETVGRGC